MQENKNAISILQHHVDSAISLIQSLKQRNQQLEAQNQALLQEVAKYKVDVNQEISKSKTYNDKIASYEEKLSTLEQLLDEAQNEQTLLEQSILTAINNLGAIDANQQAKHSHAPLNTAITPSQAPFRNARDLFGDETNDETYYDDVQASASNTTAEELEIF